MGLAIDGNIVKGIARGGQAFVPVEQLPQISSDGSITYNGKQYDTKLKITDYYYTDMLNGTDYYLEAKDLDCTKYFGKKAMLVYSFTRQVSSNVTAYNVTATKVFELKPALAVASYTDDGKVRITVNSTGSGGFAFKCKGQDYGDMKDAGMLLLIFN